MGGVTVSLIGPCALIASYAQAAFNGNKNVLAIRDVRMIQGIEI